MRVSFDECYEELVLGGGDDARRAFSEWERRPGFGAVVEFVRNFEHSVLYQLSTKDIQATLKQTEHALGNVQSTEQIREIEDFTTPFALQHLLHNFIEKAGYVPTWQRFAKWMNNEAAPYWIDQIKPLRDHLKTKYDDRRIAAAIQWRVGKFYYSAIREIDLVVSLSERGIPVRYHILADVLLRVDCWLDEKLICIYFPNRFYREGKKGRKPPAEQFFNNSVGNFSILDFEVERQGFGRTWLISQKSKDQIAKRLSS